MRSSTNCHNTPIATHTYSPSVPLSVYRELAAQLQAAEAMLDSFKAQNQHLAKRNLHLQQEIEKAVQCVLHLQQVVDSTRMVSWTHINHLTTPDFKPKPSRSGAGLRSMHQNSQFPSEVQRVKGPSPCQSEKVFTEQEEDHYRRRSQLESAPKISSWRLAIAIVLILATAFGAGYLIVRPLLQSR